uniref:Cysteine-rich CWC family protein n=1 Tax=Roseihalotalea indica TaxID=2867963 RepID=A0AA49JCN0_9BACT|nr:cysteine-rich CWC family protein [Tunicatimonas sp. TK19036]
MAKHEEKTCHRCGEIFECKVGSITLCQCTAVTLTEAERTYISQQFDECLCARCLKALQQEFKEGMKE